MSRRARPLIAAAAATAWLAACGHSAPLVLHDLTASPPATTPAAYAGGPVRVDAVRLPPALERLELLRELSPGRYTVEEFDRWAAPPSRLARRALAEDLALRLPAGTLTPAAAGGPPATAVSVEVLSFTAGPGASALSAVWLRACRPGDAPRRALVQLSGPPASSAPEALDAFMATLSDRIAADLAASPDSDCRPPPPPVAPSARAPRGG